MLLFVFFIFLFGSVVWIKEHVILLLSHTYTHTHTTLTQKESFYSCENILVPNGILKWFIVILSLQRNRLWKNFNWKSSVVKSHHGHCIDLQRSDIYLMYLNRNAGKTGLAWILMSSLPPTERSHCLYRSSDSSSVLDSAPFFCSWCQLVWLARSLILNTPEPFPSLLPFFPPPSTPSVYISFPPFLSLVAVFLICSGNKYLTHRPTLTLH